MRVQKKTGHDSSSEEGDPGQQFITDALTPDYPTTKYDGERMGYWILGVIGFR